MDYVCICNNKLQLPAIDWPQWDENIILQSRYKPIYIFYIMIIIGSANELCAPKAQDNCPGCLVSTGSHPRLNRQYLLSLISMIRWTKRSYFFFISVKICHQLQYNTLLFPLIISEITMSFHRQVHSSNTVVEMVFSLFLIFQFYFTWSKSKYSENGLEDASLGLFYQCQST